MLKTRAIIFMSIGAMLGAFLLLRNDKLMGLLFMRRTESPTTEAKAQTNIGFFQFDGYQGLDSAYFKNAPVRMALSWQQFEPEPGTFVFNARNKQARKIEEFIKNGYTVIPSIRAKSKWAVEPVTVAADSGVQKKGKLNLKGGSEDLCASAPLDLDRTKPLREGESYSETYYRFVRAIAERYKGKFPIVVIENEINDPIPEGGDWCSGVDEYLRLVLTAKKAFRDVDPAVRIADGALQPRPLLWLTIEDYLKMSNRTAALRVYSLLEGKQISYEQLLAEKETVFSEPRVAKAKEFIAKGLYQWVDIGNFHYVHHPDALADMVSFARKNAPPKKPFMSDGFGAARKNVKDENQAAKEIIYSITRLLALDINPIVLTTVPGNDRVVTSLIDMQGNLKPLNIHAFEAAARFLGGVTPSSAQETSTEKFWSYQFQSPGGTITVMWPKNNVTQPMNIQTDCDVFDYQNTQVLDTSSISPDVAPIFIACSRDS